MKMMNIVLYFDSNGEMGKEFIGFAAYEGTSRVSSILEDTYSVDGNDPKYLDYTSYTFKLEALKVGLSSLLEYINDHRSKLNDDINIICCSQHTPINDMVYTGTNNTKYADILGDIEDLIVAFDSVGVGVGISYVDGNKNIAKQNVTKMLKRARLETKGLNKSLDNNVKKMRSIADRVKSRNGKENQKKDSGKKVNIQRFKI